MERPGSRRFHAADGEHPGQSGNSKKEEAHPDPGALAGGRGGILQNQSQAEQDRRRSESAAILRQTVAPYDDRFCENVWVDGVHLGGMTQDEARAAVAQTASDRNWTITLTWNGELYDTITPATTGVTYDTEAALYDAWQQGHTGTDAERAAAMEALQTEPYVGDNIIKSIPYGTKVYVEYHLGNGWSCIRWSGAYSVAYVQSRFLVSYQPSTGPVTPIPSGTVTDNASTVAELNVIFKTYRRVANPYYVTARPVRASGWVNLRFAPTKQAEVISTHRDNDRLIVIAELAGWYQVEDPDTGAVGYMVSQYVSR